MERYLCLHGHFYQPPRENAWLEAVEVQDSARPYHDWNARISAECYGPNAWARILDGEGRIAQIINNYSRISFNFGPTLLSWLELSEPKIYAAILEGDRLSQERFSGHGSAMAQAYNHTILPLSNRRDKYTQVAWGIQDFERRFKRAPEGMWLAETAVDVETLDILAEFGIKFTVLSPYQASRFRKLGTKHWRDGTHGKIDPSRPYLVKLPSKRTISIFFYDGPISRAVAFEKLLDNGEVFAKRLASGFSDSRSWPQLVHIATDGESYGHHHRGGEMALAYALDFIEKNNLARITNYGEFLEKHPPDQQAEIVENTAWSCSHGVGRWERDCGCNSGGHGGWNQSWRAPLRAALDWLRDEIAAQFEDRAKRLLKDPWAARNSFLQVIMDRSPEPFNKFLAEHATRELSEQEQIEVRTLLELQRHGMLMYTSCGWFFDEISGLETVQILQYAARAIQLADEISGAPSSGVQLEQEFLSRLQTARSNIAELSDGKTIYERWIKPVRVDLQRVALHFAFSSMFESYSEEAIIFSYDVKIRHQHLIEVGKARLLTGRALFASRITGANLELSYIVLNMGDHNLVGGVREYQGEEAYAELSTEAQSLFERADFGGLINFINQQFGGSVYSLAALFREQQRKVVGRIVEQRLTETETQLRHIFENNSPLMRFLADYSFPFPRPLASVAAAVLNGGLREALGATDPDLVRARSLWAQAAALPGIQIDADELGLVLGEALESMMDRFAVEPSNIELLRSCETLAAFIEETGFPTNLAESQNVYYGLRNTATAEMRKRAAEDEPVAAEWVRRFDVLGNQLHFRVG